MRQWVPLLVALFAAAGCRYYRLELTQQKLAVADAIVVPGFELTDDGRALPILHNRIAMAKVLFAAGYGHKVIVSGGKPKRGITEAARMVELARHFGIPRERLIVEPHANSSVENAELSAELMVQHGLSSALLVSDAAHLSYCVPVFRDAFAARGLVLYWTPVDYKLLARIGMMQKP